MTRNGGRPGRTGAAIVLLPAAILYIVFIARTAFTIDGRRYVTLFDDAMISMQYARNLADGHGLRWNPGEPPVEGFSNLLWTLAMAAFHWLPVDDAWIALVPMAVGVIVLLATVWLAARVGDALAGESGSRAGLYAAVLTASCYPLVFWTLRGMEVGLVALGTMGLVWAFVDRRPVLVAVAAVALTLTRDDGLLPAFAVASVALLTGGKQARRLALACVAAVLVTKAAHLGWRFSYYGELVPNTYYLKLTGVSPVDRLGAGLMAWLSVVLRQIGPVLVPALLAMAWRRERVLLLVMAPFVAASAYSIAAGGDAWEYFNFANRYLSAALPPLCVLAGMGLATSRASAHGPVLAGLGLVMIAGGIWDIAEKFALAYVPLPRFVWGASMILVGAVLAAAPLRRLVPAAAITTATVVTLCVLSSNGRPYARWLAHNAHAMASDQAVTALGVAIRETTHPDATVAAFLAGSTPYFARRHAIDLFGKSDAHVARMAATSLHPGHNKVDLPYSLGLKPDVVVTLTEAPPDTRGQLEQRGYVRLCAALWARRDSARVNHDALARRCANDPNVPNVPNVPNDPND